MAAGTRDKKLSKELTAEISDKKPSGPAIEARDLAPAYANAAQVQFSPYEFMLTFLRTEYMLEGTAPDGQTPTLIATRVALSHRAMKEFLDAAIANYEKFRTAAQGAPKLKVMEDHADE